MGDKTLHDILQPLVAALRIDADYVLSDVIDSQILQYWNRRVSRAGRRHLTLPPLVAVVLVAAADVLPTNDL